MQKEFDLHLLNVIHILVNTGSVTKTAQSLNLSPGSISYALKKARNLAGRHLFIRTGKGMKPDAMALELSQRYQKFMGDIQDLGVKPAVKPLETMTIRAHALMEFKLAEKLVAASYDYQPVRHRFAPLTDSTSQRIADLKSFAVDMDLGQRLPHDPLICQIKLLSCRVSALVSESSPLSGPSLTREQWNKAKHIISSSLINYYCSSASASREAVTLFDNKNVVMVSSNNINKVAFCANHDGIILVPDFYIPVIQSAFPVKRLGLPPGLNLQYDCYMHIHHKLTEDTAMVEKIDRIITDFKQLALTEFLREEGVLYLAS